MNHKGRILGIDVARSIAIIGMIIVNFKIVFGEEGSPWLKSFAHIFDGKAAATFVVLAGVGLALMTNSAYKTQDKLKQKHSFKRILKRAVFLFITGLSYIVIWPADILHFYGVYMLISLWFLYKKPIYAFIGTWLSVFLFPVFMFLLDYESGWDFNTLTYIDFWQPEGFIRHLFFNGFHPVFPWVGFMLYGVWFGKQNLRDSVFLKQALAIGLSVFIGIQLLSTTLITTLAGDNASALEELVPILGTDPMPPLPFYMFNGLSIATVIISVCILISNKYKDSILIQSLNKTGQLALTFYVAHVIIGMGLIEVLGSDKLGTYSITFSVGYALAFSICCIFFAVFWLKHKANGPLEWVIRKITD